MRRVDFPVESSSRFRCAPIMGLVFAPVEWSNDMYTGYEMAILGVYFTLVVGAQLRTKEWDLCCVNSHQRVVFLEDCSETSRHHYRDLRERARIAKNLVTVNGGIQT
jgi:hypothetical protein